MKSTIPMASSNWSVGVPPATIRRSIAGLLCILLLIAGCRQSSSAPVFTLDAAFPDADAIPGWKTDGDVTTFDSETLFDLVNGQADAFFAYNFEQVAVQSYIGPEDAVARIEIWQLATPTDAYGLFTRSRTGEPVDAGNGGDTDPGRRLAFWQDRYYVHIRGQQLLSDDILRAFADAVSSVSCSGWGEASELLDASQTVTPYTSSGKPNIQTSRSIGW